MYTPNNKSPYRVSGKGFCCFYKKKKNGSDLLSHIVSHAVPSALRSLTSVFGMGTGVSSSLRPPEKSEI